MDSHICWNSHIVAIPFKWRYGLVTYVCMHKQPICDSISIEVWICFIFISFSPLAWSRKKLFTKKTQIVRIWKTKIKKTPTGWQPVWILRNILDIRMKIIFYRKIKWQKRAVYPNTNVPVINNIKRSSFKVCKHLDQCLLPMDIPKQQKKTLRALQSFE